MVSLLVVPIWLPYDCAFAVSWIPLLHVHFGCVAAVRVFCFFSASFFVSTPPLVTVHVTNILHQHPTLEMLVPPHGPS